MAERGKIRNREYATQVRDFSGLQFGTITPTDIDALIEFKNKCYVIIEAKHEGATMPRGQELALERLCIDLKKPAIVLVGEHSTTGDIDFAEMTVTKLFHNGRWREPKMVLNVRQATDLYLEFTVTNLDGFAHPGAEER